jgi:hypothetical protein
MINKPLGLSPAGIEFKRAHLYDINPVGVGAMLAATIVGTTAISGVFGATLQSLAAFPCPARRLCDGSGHCLRHQGCFYVARTPRQDWGGQTLVRCAICEHQFEPEDMAHCPAYSGPICSLCCTLETRCRDCCKPQARVSRQARAVLARTLPDWAFRPLNSDVGRYLGVLFLFGGVIGGVLSLVYFQITLDSEMPKAALRSALWSVFFILTIIAGVIAWLFVLAQDSRRVAEEETRRQTDLLMREIEAHKRTDAKLQKAKEVAEAASKAKSRHVVGLSHELRTPLNAILGYSQLLERDTGLPPRRIEAIKVIRRSSEHLAGLIDGLLDISKIEAGRFQLNRNEVRTSEFLDQLVDMFRLQATAKGIAFHYEPARTLPAVVHTDENRLRRFSSIFCPTGSNSPRRPGDLSHQVPLPGRRARGRGHRRRHPPQRLRADLPAVRARAHCPRQGDGRTGLGLTITKLLINVMGGEHHGQQRGRTGQQLSGQAAAVGSAASPHRVHAGRSRARLCRAASERPGRRRCTRFSERSSGSADASGL